MTKPLEIYNIWVASVRIGMHDTVFTTIISYRIYVTIIFIRIVAAATIDFSLVGVQLLIEDGSYSRKAFIYFGGIRLGRSSGILL